LEFNVPFQHKYDYIRDEVGLEDKWQARSWNEKLIGSRTQSIE